MRAVMTPLLAVAILASASAVQGETPAAGAGDQVLAVRLCVLIGGRKPGAAPVVGSIQTRDQLARFAAEWDPGSDNEELQEVLGLSEIGEVVRQVATLPVAGGDVHTSFLHEGSSFEARAHVEPFRSDGTFLAAVELSKNGEVLAKPQVASLFGQRATLSIEDGPEAPFLLVVIDAERKSVEDLKGLGLRYAFDPTVGRVDGERTLAPRLLHKSVPGYPEQARKKGTQGTVVVDLHIDASGRVGDSRVVQGQPDGLSEAAESAVRDWVFEPATRDGEPVDVLYLVTVAFRLSDDAPKPTD